MKHTLLALVSAAALAVASEHAHHVHQHLHEKRDPSPVVDVVVSGPTVVVYELSGKFISEAEVEQGIQNGTLVYASNGQLAPAVSSTVAPTTTSTPMSTSTPSSTYVAPTSTSMTALQQHNNMVAVAPSSSSSSSTTSTSTQAPAPQTASAAPAAQSPSTSGGSGVDTDFPDGQLSCSTFPSQYGAVNVDWLGLGGWTGVQSPGSALGGFSNIFTQTSSTCSGSNCCTEGSFCSYACPAGYQKAQWPTTQGLTGQSVGGIQCSNGKLHLTNKDLSTKLCIKGVSQVNVEVVNNLSKNVAVCRTDYPGTEGMTIPIDAQPGTTQPVTCPDATSYYHWQGGSTSAQYYVNPAGVSVSTACQWGTKENPWGNFAPMNIGVGWSNGAAWLSIFQNAPTTDAKLDFSVEIQGDNLSGSCKYSNGQYCSSTGCSQSGGCTVSLSSGTAKFVFS